MSKPETLIIDEVKYVRADIAQPDTKEDIKIVVLDRGFVYVGRVEVGNDGIVIRNAKNIRVWGTTKGLGELVNGPTPNTRLDQVGTVRATMRAVIHMIDVVQSKWTGC